VRVCGDETIVVNDDAAQFYIEGIDSLAVITVTEATFAAWFTLSDPANPDECTVREYEIYKNVFPALE